MLFTRGATIFLWLLMVCTLEFAFSLMPQRDAVIAGALLVGISIVIQVRREGFEASGPAALFALTMTVFVWLRPLISFTSTDFNLHTIEVLSGIPVADADESIYFSVLVASMVAYSATVLCHQLPTRAPEPNLAREVEPPFLPSFLQVWQLLFWGGAAASFLQSMLYLRYFLSGGSYYDLYLLGKSSVDVAGLSFLASFLFYGYLGLLLSTDRSSPSVLTRRRWLWTTAFVLLSLFGLARGSRGEVFTQLLAGLWMTSITSRRRIPMKVWMFSGAGLFGLSQLVGSLRAGEGASLGGNTLVKLLEWFVYTQGASGELVAVANEKFGVSLANLRFIFSPLLGPFRLFLDPEYGTQTAHQGLSSGLLSNELAYRVAPDYYLAGHGAGSSYLAETYCALGLFGVLAATALLTWLVLRGPKVALRSTSALFIFAGTLPYILFTPRESLVFPVVPALKALLIMAVCRALRETIYLLRSGADFQSG
ncbi:MAG TPA: O-antigen polysaccharide polymerase Wzy [Terracidiphilus sp.]|nr:O-antigen polysaccharide polymerase Wzy [Terracidiphilus sp.]